MPLPGLKKPEITNIKVDVSLQENSSPLSNLPPLGKISHHFNSSDKNFDSLLGIKPKTDLKQKNDDDQIPDYSAEFDSESEKISNMFQNGSSKIDAEDHIR